MKDLNITASETTPGIECSNGHIILSGRSLSPESASVFNILSDWLKVYLTDPAPDTIIDVRMEYIDASSTKIFYNILRQISTFSVSKTMLKINWHYDFNDIEMLELGEIMQGRLDIAFDFIEMK